MKKNFEVPGLESMMFLSCTLNTCNWVMNWNHLTLNRFQWLEFF